MRATLAAILLTASVTYQCGGRTEMITAQKWLDYRPMYCAGRAGILPRVRRILAPVSPGVWVAIDGEPDGWGAVSVDGNRVDVREDGRAR